MNSLTRFYDQYDNIYRGRNICPQDTPENLPYATDNKYNTDKYDNNLLIICNTWLYNYY